MTVFRAGAVAAADQFDHDLQSAGETIEGDWNALRGKAAADIARLKSKVAEKQVERNVTRLADRAARRESEACVAIDFARRLDRERKARGAGCCHRRS